MKVKSSEHPETLEAYRSGEAVCASLDNLTLRECQSELSTCAEDDSPRGALGESGVDGGGCEFHAFPKLTASQSALITPPHHSHAERRGLEGSLGPAHQLRQRVFLTAWMQCPTPTPLPHFKTHSHDTGPHLSGMCIDLSTRRY